MQRSRTMLLTLALVLAVTACGGDDSGGDDKGSDDGNTATSAGSGDDQLVVGGDLDMPDFFPSDIYLPDDINIESVLESPASDMISLMGTFESGDPAAIQKDMVAGLRAAGYEFLTDDEGIAVFIKNGVGRVRVRAREFLGDLTLTVDIDTWTDAQLDELRALFAEEIVVDGSATADYGSESLSADGECRLTGPQRFFLGEDVSITAQVDERSDPPLVYADITTPDGVIYTIDTAADFSYEATDQRITISGQMREFNNEAAGAIEFSIEATCSS